MKLRAFLAAIGTVVILCGQANAAPFFYDEAISGDIDDSVATPFNFDFGNNIVRGTFFDNFDAFNIVLPENSVLKSVQVDWAPVGPNGLNGNSFDLLTFNPFEVVLETFIATFDDFDTYSEPGSVTEIINRSFAVGTLPGDVQGNLRFGFNGLVTISPGPQSTNMDFTVTFNVVHAVPVPAALPLLASAIVGFSVMARFRKRRARAATRNSA
ncbi:VPLPA-CTERM sorting domain-containing protein [Hwanghaeella grinnelliae]|uniref:VPLPA-CTERM sorting domain-containing protein n=1 Tax=Hwanghaeella grinnelliae TaxID=2500179 RepID=A0A3S2VSL0_9PROT|nr:VPLPA-CTERM sorting domain-containing protein [Hwanghaeella grinnelliae]RVU38840.1 VPLPA-CTERM sorting domain-containing protein [Hwanghaeella grinnelliae]